MSQTTANITGIHAPIVLIVSLVAQPVYGQKATKNPVREPVQATVCNYVQKVDMCGECPKSPIVNARAWLDSA